MNTFTLALLQLPPCTTLEESRVQGLQGCTQAKQAGADLAVLPEMWSIGYDITKMTANYALTVQSSYVQSFCKHAQEINLAIALPLLMHTEQGSLTNNVLLIDRTGTIILNYAKTRICNFEEGTETTLTAGSEYPVTNLTYEHGTIRIGALICFDREFPEPARALTRQGVELIIIPNACPLVECPVLADARFAQIRSRAFENKAAVVVTNYPSPFQDGNSVLCDYKGAIIAQAKKETTILVASLDLTALRAWQKNEPWGPSIG